MTWKAARRSCWKPTSPKARRSLAGALDTAKRIVENRVNGLGVSEAVVQKQGDTRIIAELPGVSNPDQAVETIRSTGQLEFVDPKGATAPAGHDDQHDQ